MNRKRLLLILGCLGLLLLAGYATLWLTAPRHRITEENIEAIKEGMTEKEVEAILGAQAGDYSSKQTGGQFAEIEVIIIPAPRAQPVGKTRSIFTGFTGPDFVKSRGGGKYWVGEETGVWVRFDEAGRVAEIWPGLSTPSGNESFLDKLRRWLGMQ